MVAAYQTMKTPSPKQVARDPVLFAEKFLKIQNNRMQIIPLRYNYFQLKYLQERSSRDIILKPRQLGFTTCIQGEFRRYEWTRSARTLTLGKDDENTTDIRNMADFFYDSLPDEFRPIRSINNATRTSYPLLNSRATIRTAGNRNSGRGGTNTHIHLSEAAFYPDANSIIASALQAGNALWVAVESSPNGAQEWFYEECNLAIAGKSIFKFHFFTWFDNPAYALSDEQLITLLPNGESVLHIPYDDEEKMLIEKHHLTRQQINWRRYKVIELADKFQQEYPEDPVTCFLTSGRGVFQLNKPDLFTDYVEDRSLIGYPVWLLDGYVPDDKSVHVAAIDWGQAPDSTVLSIMDSTTYQEIALYVTGKRDYEHIISDLATLIKHFNVQYVVPEKNAMRLQISLLAKQLKEAMPDNPPRVSPFNMDLRRKDDLVKLMQQGMNSGLRLLDVPMAKHELRIFEARQNTSGSWSYTAPDGEHDDTVIARMLAHLATYQLRERY